MRKEGEYSFIKFHKINFGSYSVETDLDISQIEYCGGEFGYTNLLKVNNPPEGKNPYIVHTYREGSYLDESADSDNLENYIFYSQGIFAEFDNLKNAKLSFSKSMMLNSEEKWFESKGVMRNYAYDKTQEPWFYCKKEEISLGIFVLPLEGQIEFIY